MPTATWSQAQRMCAALQSSLSSISSGMEMDVIRQFAQLVFNTVLFQELESNPRNKTAWADPQEDIIICLIRYIQLLFFIFE